MLSLSLSFWRDEAARDAGNAQTMVLNTPARPLACVRRDGHYCASAPPRDYGMTDRREQAPRGQRGADRRLTLPEPFTGRNR